MRSTAEKSPEGAESLSPGLALEEAQRRRNRPETRLGRSQIVGQASCLPHNLRPTEPGFGAISAAMSYFQRRRRA